MNAFRLILIATFCAGWIPPTLQGGTSTSVGDLPLEFEWKTFNTADGLPSNKVMAVKADESRVWAGTDAGLALLSNESIRVFTEADGLPFPVISALTVSAESGDLWIGTLGGLARYSAGRIDRFTQLNSGLANNVVYDLAVEGAIVWAATATGLSRYDTVTDTWTSFDHTNTLMHEPWTYGVCLAANKVYVAVWGGGVVVLDEETGRWREHHDPDGEMEIDLLRDDGLVHDVTSTVSVSDGILWVGTYFGLSRYDGRRWKSYSATDSGIAGDFINRVKATEDRVWIATDTGLSCFDSRNWQTWRRSPSGNEMEIISTDAQGHSSTQHADSGLASNTIFGIDLSPNGTLWLATDKGLCRAMPAVRATNFKKTTQPGK